MVAHILLLIFIVFLIISKIYFGENRYYKKANFIAFVSINVFTVFWLIAQYNFAYAEYGVAQADASVSIIPGIVMSISGMAVLCIAYDFLYVLFHLPKN